MKRFTAQDRTLSSRIVTKNCLTLKQLITEVDVTDDEFDVICELAVGIQTVVSARVFITRTPDLDVGDIEYALQAATYEQLKIELTRHEEGKLDE